VAVSKNPTRLWPSAKKLKSYTISCGYNKALRGEVENRLPISPSEPLSIFLLAVVRLIEDNMFPFRFKYPMNAWLV